MALMKMKNLLSLLALTILLSPAAPLAHADDTGGTEFDKKMAPVADEINRIGDNTKKALTKKKKRAEKKKAEAEADAEANRDAAEQK